ncbi:cytochrome c oxidase subunit 3 family protein [Thalassotalea sp. M1531]|uniref:Cytochrome c oxidase subunit 3 family protein n=1 Tax=Thalassotalea algicola TaxID=2716224 RepID=A0A7Y0Q6T6_9GAMM|nr:cytochrome c oxidase subunit 3 family protein [Thalassotalea algicola]NMP31491.1 cytochrome c oxidase subunit 3 family protein [Thalassotalea algicola]
MKDSPANTSLNIFPKSWSEAHAGRVPGNIPIWVGILSELTEFGIFFAAYFIAKFYYPAVFAEGPQQLNTALGVTNTIVLLTSSYFMAKAMASIRIDDRKKSERFLWLAVFCGCIYLVIKVWEFHWNDLQGFSTNTSEFFTVYYYMTFNHFLHVGWASCAILYVIFRLRSGAYSSKDNSGMEALAVYWHMIDLMWILIFPLLYVLR